MEIFHILLCWLCALSPNLAAPLEEGKNNSVTDLITLSLSVAVPTFIPVSPSSSALVLANSSMATDSVPSAAGNATLCDVPEKRSVSLLHKAGDGVECPRHPGNNLIYIRYCYSTWAVRNELKCLFQEGLDMWGTALGGRPSEVTGHALVVDEAMDENRQAMVCHEDDAATIRNRNMPADVLELYIGDTDESTLGWHGASIPGLNHMQISQRTLQKQNAFTIAHEFGHVLGLGHEHQRKDRDDYMLFQCDQIANFWDAYNKASLVDIHLKGTEIRERLCTNREYGKRYNFNIGNFMKYEESSAMSFVFDWDSIMLYGTGVGANPACAELESACPLLKKSVDGSTGQTKYVRFQGGKKPSVRDAAFVKQTYPFLPPGAPAPGGQGPAGPMATSEPIVEEPWG